MNDTKQLTISFDHDPLISEQLLGDTFVTQVAVDFTTDKSEWSRVEKFIRGVSELGIEGLAFIVRCEAGVRISDLAGIKQSTGAPFVLVLNGSGCSMQQLREDAASARSIGIRNFVALTGPIAAGHQADEKGAFPDYPAGYTDSFSILRAMTAEGKEQLLGAGVNPYMYLPETQCMQTASLLKKCSLGAYFLVAQAGFDPAKAQELQWFLQMRDAIVPIVARLRFFSLRETEKLSSLNEPGLTIPTPIGAKLQRLMAAPDEYRQFLFKLNALLATGYRKFGYSGIAIDGLTEVKDIKEYLDVQKQLDGEITSYNDWLRAWKDLTDGMSLVPPPSTHSTTEPYYLFERLLTRDNCFYSQDIKMVRRPLQKPPAMLARKVSWTQPGSKGILPAVAKLVTKAKPEWQKCYGLDNSACPKRLTEGPCGYTRPDGYCEADHAPCFFNVIAQLAHQRKELGRFEV